MIVFLDGELLPIERAAISPLDRSFLFADGVYEGLRASDGHIIALDAHVERLRRSLDEIRLRRVDPGVIVDGSERLLKANDLRDAFLYWQVSRGAPLPGEAPRGRAPGRTRPTVFGYAAPLTPIERDEPPPTRACALIEDPRWRRNDIKSVSLLGSVLPAIEAVERGDADAILHREALLTEATSANVFVAAGDRVRTPPLGEGQILAGVTRGLLLEAMPAIEEAPIPVEEALQADEIMLVGTTTMVTSVGTLDGRPVGSGTHPGPWARRMREALIDAIERDRARSRDGAAARGGRTLRA